MNTTTDDDNDNDDDYSFNFCLTNNFLELPEVMPGPAKVSCWIGLNCISAPAPADPASGHLWQTWSNLAPAEFLTGFPDLARSNFGRILKIQTRYIPMVGYRSLMQVKQRYVGGYCGAVGSVDGVCGHG